MKCQGRGSGQGSFFASWYFSVLLTDHDVFSVGINNIPWHSRHATFLICRNQRSTRHYCLSSSRDLDLQFKRNQRISAVVIHGERKFDSTHKVPQASRHNERGAETYKAFTLIFCPFARNT